VATANRDLVEVTACELRDGDRDGSLMKGRRIVGTPRPLPGGRVLIEMQWANGKRDIARPEAHRRFRVVRQVAGAGMACRHRARARTTGGVVEVWDTAHADSPVHDHDVKGFRWAMRCEHGTAVGRRTFDEACEDVRDPRLWCEQCVHAVAGAAQLPL